ncbi:hypothetical protein AAHE18_03G132000 [Arachis hypogaea]
MLSCPALVPPLPRRRNPSQLFSQETKTHILYTPYTTSTLNSNDHKPSETELKECVPQLKAKSLKFDPSTIAGWEKGTSVLFSLLALVLDMVSEEFGRIKMTDIGCGVI